MIPDDAYTTGRYMTPEKAEKARPADTLNFLYRVRYRPEKDPPWTVIGFPSYRRLEADGVNALGEVDEGLRDRLWLCACGASWSWSGSLCPVCGSQAEPPKHDNREETDDDDDESHL